MLAAGLVVLAGLGAWRLSQGPIPLDLLRPYVERLAAAPDGSYKASAGRMTLNWAGWDRALEIRVSTLEVRGPAGEVVATVPEAAVQLSAAALLTGRLAPSAIALDRLRLHLVVQEDGRLALDLPADGQDGGAGALPALLEGMLGGGNPLLAHLERITISHAELTLDDRRNGVQWRAPAARMVLARDRQGVLAEATLDLLAGERRAAVNLRALYAADSRSLGISLNFEQLEPAVLATVDPSLAWMAGLRLPVGGTILAEASGEGEIRKVDVNLLGGPGSIAIPGAIEEPRAVTSATLRGGLDLAGGIVRLEAFEAELGTARLTATGTGERRDGRLRFDGEARIANLPIADLGGFWPAEALPGGRRWTMANISDGSASATIRFRLGADAAAGPLRPAIEALDGQFSYSGLTVHYLRPMPPVTGVGGTGTFNEREVRFDIAEGKAGELAVGATQVVLSGLDGPTDHRAAIDTTASGPLSAMLRLLGEPKVGLPPELALNPAQASGQVAARLQIRLPLIDALTMREVEFTGSAAGKGVGLKDIVPGVDLSDGNLTVQVNGREMDVHGKARLAGLPADVQWRENFSGNPRRRYDVKGTVDVAELHRLGVDVGGHASGPVGAVIALKENANGSGDIVVSLDLRQAALRVAELGWRKEPGAEATAKLTVPLREGRPQGEIDFLLGSGATDAKGRVKLAPGGGWSGVTFERLNWGRNRLHGIDVQRVGADAYAVRLSGESLDVAPFLAGEHKAPRQEPAAPPAGTGGPVLDITLDLRQLLVQRGGLRDVRGRLRLEGGRMASADMAGQAGSSTVQFRVEPRGGGRDVDLEVSDAGVTLSALGWLEGVIGGQLDLDAHYDDAKPGSPLSGRLRMKDYKLVKTPVVKDVLSVAPLTDALSAFGSSGLEFSRLDAPFTLEGGVLQLDNARTSGTSLGITATGRVNTNDDTVRMEGTIVPAYVLNSFLSHIPIIGHIIAGGPGGGIFAINYGVEGPVASPKVVVNPLSALAPGFLRNLFGALPDEQPAPAAPPDSPQAPPQAQPQLQPQPQPQSQPEPAAGAPIPLQPEAPPR